MLELIGVRGTFPFGHLLYVDNLFWAFDFDLDDNEGQTLYSLTPTESGIFEADMGNPIVWTEGFQDRAVGFEGRIYAINDETGMLLSFNDDQTTEVIATDMENRTFAIVGPHLFCIHQTRPAFNVSLREMVCVRARSRIAFLPRDALQDVDMEREYRGTDPAGESLFWKDSGGYPHMYPDGSFYARGNRILVPRGTIQQCLIYGDVVVVSCENWHYAFRIVSAANDDQMSLEDTVRALRQMNTLQATEDELTRMRVRSRLLRARALGRPT